SGCVPSSSPLVRWLQVPSSLCSCAKPSTWPNSWMMVLSEGVALEKETVVCELAPGNPITLVLPSIGGGKLAGLTSTTTLAFGKGEPQAPHPVNSMLATRLQLSVTSLRISSRTAALNPG